MGNLAKIREISVKYNISARTLRYYEDMGLIESTRSDGYAYRLYDEAAIRRLEQILILRRLNISIKDIKSIFSTAGSEVVLDVLEKKVDHIDEEVSLLHELRSIVLEFIRQIRKLDFESEADIKLLYENGIDCDVFPVSARKRTNIAKLEKYLADRLPQGEKVISEDIVSDKSEKFMISEIMREKILLKFSEEIPHGVAISVNVFKKQENGVYDINLDIVCEKPNHKAIIIGKQGKALKEVASFARQDMEKFLGAKVFLTTYVKVKEDWRNRPNILTELGYND